MLHPIWINQNEENKLKNHKNGNKTNNLENTYLGNLPQWLSHPLHFTLHFLLLLLVHLRLLAFLLQPRLDHRLPQHPTGSDGHQQQD
jgi:hypothetical protein